MAGHVPAVVKVGSLAKLLRAMPLQPGWLWPRVEEGRQVCPDFAQTVKARRPAVAQPASVSLRAMVGREACLVQMVKAMRRLLALQLVLRRRQDHRPVYL
jgi:hypothetical protein